MTNYQRAGLALTTLWLGATAVAQTPGGFIRHWLVLGPLETQGLWVGDPTNPPENPDASSGAPGDDDLRLDYLTDGAVTEKSIRPFDGMRLAPRFGGDGRTGAKSKALEATPRACAPGVPTWESFVSTTGTFVHDDYFGGEVDSHATYAGCYLTNPTGGPLQVKIATASDDAFIAYLNGEEVAAYQPPPCSSTACGRGYGPEDNVQERFSVTLPAGESFLLVRVHDGAGASGFRLRLENTQGEPLLPPRITVA